MDAACFPMPKGFKKRRWSDHTKLSGGAGARLYFHSERTGETAVVLIGYFGDHLPTVRFDGQDVAKNNFRDMLYPSYVARMIIRLLICSFYGQVVFLFWPFRLLIPLAFMVFSSPLCL